jgi:hypothetical protein
MGTRGDDPVGLRQGLSARLRGCGPADPARLLVRGPRQPDAASGGGLVSPPARVDVWRIDADGANAVNLTADSPANDALPHISADGRRIVFRSDRDGGRQVYVMDGDGRNVRRLSDAGGVETMPALSPDGEWVVFPTDRTGGMQLYVQHVDGYGGRFLEPDRVGLPEFNMHPRFSPDARWVVFTSSRSGFNDEWPLTLFHSRTVSSGPSPLLAARPSASRTTSGRTARATGASCGSRRTSRRRAGQVLGDICSLALKW